MPGVENTRQQNTDVFQTKCVFPFRELKTPGMKKQTSFRRNAYSRLEDGWAKASQTGTSVPGIRGFVGYFFSEEIYPVANI